MQYGYNVELIEGYEFSQINPFAKYVEHFFELKRVQTGAEKTFTKLMLNSLYGFFGQPVTHPTTLLVSHEEAKIIHDHENVVSESTVTPSTLLIQFYKTTALLDALKEQGFGKLLEQMSLMSPSTSNVALAAAVTSYGRMTMNYFKRLPGNTCYYTDTDSVFLQKPLDPSLVSSALGAMKDELNGGTISNALFLGQKQYGYQYGPADQLNTVSVYAGIPRNLLT